MSDETIQYITTDYLIEVDGGEPTPAPIEYIVELGQVGVQGIPGEKGEPGFSPTVGYILNDNTFRINITNQDGVTQTPNLYDYLASKGDLNGYLRVNGSNAQQDITINQAQFISLSNNSGVRIRKSGGGALQLDTTSSYLTAGGTRSLSLTGGGKSILLSDKAYYDNKQIATINDIGNGTITLTQGGVTKGTFTTNQSGNTTIDLDAGGGTITNPLHIGYTNNNINYNLNLGVDETTSKVISSYIINTEGSTLPPYIAPIKLLTESSNPLVLAENQDGLYNLSLNIDDTTIKVNQSGQLYAVGGGGGTTYTAGTGIDITDDVISIDTDVVAQVSDIPDTTYMVTTNTAQTISGVKTFSSETHHTGVITFDSAMLNPIIRGMSGSSYRNMIYRMGNNSAIIVGNSNDTIDLKGSGTRPTYNSGNLALYSDIPTNSTYVDLTSAQTITGKKTFSGAEIETNNIITLSNNAIIRGLHSGNYSTYLSSNSTSLLLGNESNNIKLRGNTTRPVYRTGGTDYNIALLDDIPSLSGYVTTTDLSTALADYVSINNIDQNIGGVKAFTGTLRLISGSTVIRNSSNTGNVGSITSDATSLIISTPASNRNINLKPNGTGEVQYNGTKIATINDISSISNLADKNLSNLSSTGKAVIDGQWVVANQVIGSNEAVGSYVIDLSNVLPADNYKYEVILSLYMYAIAIDVYYQSVETTLFPPTALNTVTGTGTYPTVSSTTATMIIDADKYFKYSISSNGNTTPDGSSITLVAYRRIGTNS